MAFEGALTANAYLGGFGIAAALTAGADVVVTGRVTDASVVVGPAIAHFGWTPTSYDELAGAVVAGHVIECGAQATGGNFSGFRRLVQDGMDPARPLGFPIAEIAADGSSVITKHDGTGGAVTVDTVTAQLVYEIQTTRYLNPDVTTWLDTIRLEQDGPDRVAVTGVRGEPPPERLKVCVNELGGFRNQVEFVLTGLDVEEKAEWVREQLTPALTATGRRPGRGSRLPPPDADTEEARLGAAPLHGDGPAARPGRPRLHRPGGRARARVVPRLHDDHPAAAAEPRTASTAPSTSTARSCTTRWSTPTGAARRSPTRPSSSIADPDEGRRPSPYPAPADSLNRRMPLGTFVHARSGDKGGDANIGLWVANDGDPAPATPGSPGWPS